jgi:hypothetical protein
VNDGLFRAGLNLMIDSLSPMNRDAEGQKLLDRFYKQARETACCTCDARHTCEFAFESYNVDVVPGIDCLAAK